MITLKMNSTYFQWKCKCHHISSLWYIFNDFSYFFSLSLSLLTFVYRKKEASRIRYILHTLLLSVIFLFKRKLQIMNAKSFFHFFFLSHIWMCFPWDFLYSILHENRWDDALSRYKKKVKLNRYENSENTVLRWIK